VWRLFRARNNKHAYAQHRYEELIGWSCPAAGGPVARDLTPEQRKRDFEVRLIISRELGHERELTPAFASSLEMLMDGDRAALWVHGHMHDAFDYEIYGTRVVCNPRGYAPNALNADFRPDLVVKI
jgi:hypothetical protein